MAPKHNPVVTGTPSQIPDDWPSPGLLATIERSRSFYSGKRAVVTGAFGFAGGHLVRALHSAGAHVAALDADVCMERPALLNLTGIRTDLEIVRADITDREAMQELVTTGQFDFVFHLAAGATVIEKALHDPYATIMANTMGFVNIAEAARLLPEPERPVILYSSTDKVYGEARELPYTEERSNLGGVGVYDAAKLAADIFAGTYHKALGVPTVVLRMCNLYGPYDFNFDYRLIPKALRNIFRDQKPPELYFNSLEHYRDYLYVEDMVRAFLHLAMNTQCRGRVYNLPGTLHAATPDILRSIVRMVSELQDNATDRESAVACLDWDRSLRIIESNPNLIAISKQHLDGSRIKNEADFEPTVQFLDGLEATVRFYLWYFTECCAGTEK